MVSFLCHKFRNKKMNKEEKLEKLNHMKNYFFTSFWISFVLLLIASMMCMVFSDFYAGIASKFFNMEADDYSKVVLLLLGLWKILIIQFTLIPGIALCIISKYCGCKCK